MLINSFNIDSSDLTSASAIRTFTVSGDPGAVFSVFVKNEDNYYYNFNDKVFQSASSRLKLIKLSSKGTYSNEINIPTVTDDDKYTVELWAESHFDTYNHNALSRSSICSIIINQYIDTTLTFTPTTDSLHYNTLPSSVTTSEHPLSKSGKASIDWDVTLFDNSFT